jgi:hypothetical protein
MAHCEYPKRGNKSLSTTTTPQLWFKNGEDTKSAPCAAPSLSVPSGVRPPPVTNGVSISGSSKVVNTVLSLMNAMSSGHSNCTRSVPGGGVPDAAFVDGAGAGLLQKVRDRRCGGKSRTPQQIGAEIIRKTTTVPIKLQVGHQQ